jgi:hypothetical protein
MPREKRKMFKYVRVSLGDVLTISECAELTGMSTSYIRRTLNEGYFDKQIKDGKIRKAKGTWLITRKALLELFDFDPIGRNNE